MSCPMYIFGAFVVGALAATVALIFAARNNPRVVAWLGIKAPAAK